MEKRKYSEVVFRFLLIFGFSFNTCGCAKILSIFAYPGPSQYIMASALLKGLAERGHEVTSISTFPQKAPVKNFRDIPVMENAKIYETLLLESNTDIKKPDLAREIFQHIQAGASLVNNVLNNTQVKQLMTTEKFDLIIMEVLLNDGLFGLGEHFNAPMVGVSTLGTTNFIDYMVGNPTPWSYIPNIRLPFGNRMSLKERLINVLVNLRGLFIFQKYVLPIQENLYRQYFPQAKRTLDEARKSFSLILLNTHFSLDAPRPFVSNMIEVGGLHIKQKIDPLPADMQRFLDNASTGAIYFSMGSNLKAKHFPRHILKIFLDCFAELKLKVLWKFEDDSLANVTENVLIKPWYPQPSVLAHPNVKLFISHGGLLSTTESIFHAKPILGIPMIADQPMNVKNAVRSGYALSLELHSITKESLRETIDELLTNRSYTKRVQTLSKHYRDQPITPLNTAIYWIEYVLRNDGAYHLRNAGQYLSFWQYHNIDVWAIIAAGLVVGLVGLVLILKLLKSLIFLYISSQRSSKEKAKLS